MPIVPATYQANKFWLRSAHLNTITPALFRSVKGVRYQRAVLELDDGDFLDLDWFQPSPHSEKLVLVLHGLEGAADRPYVRGMCRYFGEGGWHALALNQRTCGGRMNRLVRAYHMGSTDDVARVVQHAIERGYQKIALVGFSMGGNHVMKYLGEQGHQLPPEVLGGVAFSVPCHIASANVEIDKFHNRIYLNRFLKGLNEKMHLKKAAFPDLIELPKKMPTSFQAFDDVFTGPLHGFDGAMDYWTKCSSRQFIPSIQRPCLLVNAQDDTFLSPDCYPIDEAQEMDHFFLEMPQYGGHTGFAGGRNYWTEERAFDFFEGIS